MLFKPAAPEERWEGLAVCAWILIFDLLLVQWIIQRQTDWLLFALIFLLVLSIVLLLHVAYRTWVAFTLEYVVDRNALTVRWADVKQTIPLTALRRIVLGAEDVSHVVWRDWPASYVSVPASSIAPGAMENQLAMLLATRPPAECLLLETDLRAFALSPAATEPFIEAIQDHVRMGPASSTPFVYERRYDPVNFFTADRAGITLLGLGLLFGLILAGVLMVRFPGLPDALAVRYSTEGIPEQVREKSALFLLPAIGLMAWFVNGIWGLIMAARGRSDGAYLLWGGTLLVQACAFLALVGLIGWR